MNQFIVALSQTDTVNLISMLITSIGLASLLVILLDNHFAKLNRHHWLGKASTSFSWMDNTCQWLINRFSFPFKDIEQKLVQAGIYSSKVVSTLAKVFFPAKVTLGASAAIFVSALSPSFETVSLSGQLAYALTAFVITIFLPDILLEVLKKRRTQRVVSQLPYLLDLMAVCIQTGMTIESAIAYLGDELNSFNKGLAHAIRRVASVSRVSGIRQALAELAEQFPSNQMRSLVYTLDQSLQFGSSISSVLATQAENLRRTDMLSLEEKVAKLSAKMSVPLILFIMFPLVVLITAPGIMRILTHV